MHFVLACDGSRGDVEPCVAVGSELLRRGHQVRAAVPPNLLGFVESAGLAAVGYGLDTRTLMETRRNLACASRNPRRILTVIRLFRDLWDFRNRCWKDISTTLVPLAREADLLLTGRVLEDAAANVAEYYDIPLATLHYLPVRSNGRLGRVLSASLSRLTTSRLEDAQRRELGLPKTRDSSPRQITGRTSLEIAAYDQVCFPNVADARDEPNRRRAVVGPLTMELSTDTDDDVASWVAAGTPPIFFGFGSMPLESAAGTLDMITAACAELGERALVGAGWSDFDGVRHTQHVRVVDAVNHAAIFPTCRAVVHHGGAGTTAAGLRAGVPALVLWWAGDQPLWAAVVQRLRVGAGRHFSTATRESLVADLRRILAPQYLARAREVAGQMTTPAEAVAVAADLLEDLARLPRVG
jgi:UDP:flavonoid glycosyltransferase YjiC (YdhE family)